MTEPPGSVTTIPEGIAVGRATGPELPEMMVCPRELVVKGRPSPVDDPPPIGPGNVPPALDRMLLSLETSTVLDTLEGTGYCEGATGVLEAEMLVVIVETQVVLGPFCTGAGVVD